MATMETTARRAEIQPLPLTPWETFLSEHFAWKQGEHVSLVGPTGRGKTTVGMSILEKRGYVIVMGTKPRDEKLMELRKQGYALVRDFPFPPLEFAPKVLFWPKTETVEDIVKHRAKFKSLLAEIYSQGNWALFFDELRYFTDARYLKLGSFVEILWLQGRANGVSVVGGIQRPAYVPLAAYDQATHLFLWSNNDAVNLRRLKELGGVNGDEIRAHLMRMPKHDVLYVNTVTGEMVRTNTEREA